MQHVQYLPFNLKFMKVETKKFYVNAWYFLVHHQFPILWETEFWQVGDDVVIGRPYPSGMPLEMVMINASIRSTISAQKETNLGGLSQPQTSSNSLWLQTKSILFYFLFSEFKMNEIHEISLHFWLISLTFVYWSRELLWKKKNNNRFDLK